MKYVLIKYYIWSSIEDGGGIIKRISFKLIYIHHKIIISINNIIPIT